MRSRYEVDGFIYYSFSDGFPYHLHIRYDGLMTGFVKGNRKFRIQPSGIVYLWLHTDVIRMTGTEWPEFVKEFYNLFNYAKTIRRFQL